MANPIVSKPDEAWKPVTIEDGFFADRYEVSSHGRVKSLRFAGTRTPGLRKTPVGKNGYPYLTLCKNGHTTVITVHTLVAHAFLGPRPPRMEVNHRDGCKTNNRLENLEYVTVRQNALHAHDRGLIKNQGQDNPQAVLTEDDILAIREEYATTEANMPEIAARYGVTRGAIYDIIHRINWKHLPQRYPIRSGRKDRKLTADDVRRIRKRYAEGDKTQPELADEYGVHDSYICMIIKRKRWKHV